MSDRALCFVLALCGLFSHFCEASTLVFSTGFEQSEGYVADLAVAGQKGWVGQGTGGNVITHTLNQQVRLGYTAPTSDSETSTSVWQPVAITNIPNTLVVFSVKMFIINSTTINQDEFRFTAHQGNGAALLSLIFDNSSLAVRYNSVGASPEQGETGTNFVNGHLYSVVILMDLAGNRWTASLDGHDLPINARILPHAGPVSLGAIRASWVYRNPTAPGDNYMVFDDYRITVETVVRPSVQALSAANGQFRLRVFGEDSAKYAVEGSPNLATNNWFLLGTNSPAGGSFDFTNSMAPFSRRFYRARWVP